MSISIKGQTGWASIPNSIGRSRLPYPTLSLMINLLTHSEGFSASYTLIQEQTGMATATISTAIKNLEKLGLLTVKKMPRTGGKYASNHYTFHADNIWKLTPEFVDQRLERGKTASKNEAGKKSPTSGDEGGTASLNEVAPLQEMKTKNDQGELPVENDHSPAGVSDTDVSGHPQPNQQSSSDDRGKGRHKDFQAFLDAYGTITALDDQMIGEAARVWHSMFKDGSLPPQDELMEGLRVYWRAMTHNERVTGRSVRKRPGNWLRDHMWAADEENLRFDDRPQKSGGVENTMENWLGLPEGALSEGFGFDQAAIVDGTVVEQKELTQ